MLIRLTGLFDNGTPFAPNVAHNARRTIELPVGADATIQLDVVDNAGAPVNFASDSGSSVILTVKSQSGRGYKLFAKTGSHAVPAVVGRALFTVSRNDTKFSQPGRYIYDVWLTYNNVRSDVIPLSPFVLLAAAGLP